MKKKKNPNFLSVLKKKIKLIFRKQAKDLSLDQFSYVFQEMNNTSGFISSCYNLGGIK